MKSADVVDGGLFTESYCYICNAQLISESQRTAHYEVKREKKSKESLFLVLICLSSLFLSPCVRVSAPSPLQDCAETEVDRNKCCTLCNMFFTSAIVAQSHYQGKTHAKRVRLVLGEPPNLSAVASLTSAGTRAARTHSGKNITSAPACRHHSWERRHCGVERETTRDSPQAPAPTDSSACPPTSPALPLPVAVVGGNGGREAGKYCCLCGAWFNNPLMAQQHYEGKKHRRNAARARLLEQLAGSLDATESTGLRSSYSCSICNVVLNSIEQYHAHLQGSKHQ
ncbi:unnamed protein product, partial [Tetraodon nigroviridis]